MHILERDKINHIEIFYSVSHKLIKYPIKTIYTSIDFQVLKQRKMKDTQLISKQESKETIT